MIGKTIRTLAAAALLAATLSPGIAAAEDAGGTSAVALMYHRFGENKIPSTNIRVEQFERHLQILAEGGYHVVPLEEIVAALTANRPIPPKTVAITVDDAYASALTVAWPRLKARGWPMTIFVATDPVDHHTPGYLTWDQLKKMQAEGVTIGAHSKTHAHMAKLKPEEIAAEIRESNLRFQAELGKTPKLFAYPYGEANAAVMAAAGEAYVAAFGQQSGVVDDADNRLFLPRFALNEHYGTEDRFRLVINALPLPVTDVTPGDPTIRRNPPNFGFTVPDETLPIKNLRCFSSSDGETKTEVLGRRVEVRQEKAFPGTRGRINCTMPGPNGHWLWYGRLFYIPEGIRLNNAKDD